MPASPTTKRISGATGQRKRTAARLASVQAAYEMEVTGAAADPVLESFMSKRWAETAPEGQVEAPDTAFLTLLVRGVNSRREELDALIAPFLSERKDLQQLEILLRSILRAGAYEIAFRQDVPARVAINEYVDVAHAFYAGKEPGLVNAVLDRVAQKCRSDPQDNGRT